MTGTHDGFTTSAGTHCIVEGCRVVDGKHVLKTDAKSAEAHDAQVAEAVETVAPAKPKRKRRTKAEIEADRAAAQADTDLPAPKPIKPTAPEEAEFVAADVPATAEHGPAVDIDGAQAVMARIRAGLQEGPRDPMGNIGPSMLGGCERKIGYRLLFGSDGERDDDSWIARVGTGAHTELDKMFDGVVETDGTRRWFPSLRVQGFGVKGAIDLYDAARFEVIDFKVVGAGTLTRARRGEVDVKYDVQLDVYGLLLSLAGHRVERVAALFLPKTQGLGKAYWYSRPVDLDRAFEAIARRDRIRGMVTPSGNTVEAGALEAHYAMALSSLAATEDFCSSCPALRDGYCKGIAKIERCPEWPAYDAVLAAMEAAA